MKRFLPLFMAFVMLFTMFTVTSVVAFAEGTETAVASETEELGFFQQIGIFFDNIGKAFKNFFEDIEKAFSILFNGIFGTGSEPIEPIEPIEPVEPVKPVEEWSKQEILDFYNQAVIKTDLPENQLQGQKKMVLSNGGQITADNGLGSIFQIISPVIQDALKRNSSSTSDIPGYGEITLNDIKDIKATEKNGVITVEIVGKEQTDGPIADGSAGPVGRVIGTVGNIDGVLNELGAEIPRGKDTVTLTYTDVTVRANINANTGLITGGTWHYLVNILVKDADIKLVVNIGVKNLKAAVDYTVTF